MEQLVFYLFLLRCAIGEIGYYPSPKSDRDVAPCIPCRRKRAGAISRGCTQFVHGIQAEEKAIRIAWKSPLVDALALPGPSLRSAHGRQIDQPLDPVAQLDD